MSLLRREVITLICGVAAAWPLTVGAQQALPVIGWLSVGSAESDALRLTGFRQGLNAIGYVEGQNVAIEYRWAQVQYGANFPDLYRRAADFVDKILRGAKPADIAVEQPTRFDLVVNLITAKALGLTIPPAILDRADEVIE